MNEKRHSKLVADAYYPGIRTVILPGYMARGKGAFHHDREVHLITHDGIPHYQRIFPRSLL